jgi:hypothetical protein
MGTDFLGEICGCGLLQATSSLGRVFSRLAEFALVSGGQAIWMSGTGPTAAKWATLDTIFFTVGGFSGSNRKGLWEQLVSSAEAHLRVANIAGQGHNNVVAPDKILAQAELITGPAIDRPPAPPPRVRAG